MPLDSGVSLVWECCSKDFSPFLLSRPFFFWSRGLVSNGLAGYVVAASCFVLKKPFSVNVLATARRSPEFLIRILICHPTEEVTAHEIVVQERLIPMLVGFDELIG